MSINPSKVIGFAEKLFKHVTPCKTAICLYVFLYFEKKKKKSKKKSWLALKASSLLRALVTLTSNVITFLF